jgi:ADP-ribose pyrophosphatase
MKIVGKKNVFDGHYRLNLIQLESKNGESFEREQFETPDSVGVLVHDLRRKKVILVRQFRVGPEKLLLEIVAGKVENKDDDLETTAKREVLEEVGYEVERIEKLHSFHPAPGPVSELMTLFYATLGQRKSEGGGLADEHEEIEVVEMDEAEFKVHQFQDAKTLIAQHWFARNF